MKKQQQHGEGRLRKKGTRLSGEAEVTGVWKECTAALWATWLEEGT